MPNSRIRVLVLAEAKELAEALGRGLSGLDAELDVAIEANVARMQMKDVSYDLFVVEQRHLSGNGRSLIHDIPCRLPVVAVGGEPATETSGGLRIRYVPLPLSFNLLRKAVRGALGKDDPDEPDFGLDRGRLATPW